jgi:hypothetical protein
MLGMSYSFYSLIFFLLDKKVGQFMLLILLLPCDNVMYLCLIRVSFTRKSCQTVLIAHLLYLVRAIAPIMPHLAEDVWQNLPFQYTLEDGSPAKFIFDQKWPEKNEEWLSVSRDDVDFMGVILEVPNFLHICDVYTPIFHAMTFFVL